MGRAGRLSVHTLGTCPRCEGRNHSFLHASRLSATESGFLRHLSVTFLTRRDCHLCDEARPVLNRVAQRMNVQINEVDIDTDDDLVKRYGLRVPVLLAAHDRVIAEGVIDDRTLLRDALEREFSL
ncbi:MAG TPA: glutaredoxin family protein [Acidimicrobiia bacterium]|nr:glutaredoxin family protein [Acidimicrobiia bacterium]